MMPCSILLILIGFFLLSSFGNAFVLHAKEDSKLHGQRATSMNKQTMDKRTMHEQVLKKSDLFQVPNPSSKSLVSKSNRGQKFQTYLLHKPTKQLAQDALLSVNLLTLVGYATIKIQSK